MEQVVKMRPFNKRAFISTALFISGFSLPFSGFMNHSLQFDKFSLERHFWMSVHDVAGILFVLFVILHISYNWKALLNYAKKAKEIFISKEALTALVFVIVIVGLVSSHAFHIGN
jgi:succinate dehydrogenase/fumarate reductase cytochrome b subunit